MASRCCIRASRWCRASACGCRRSRWRWPRAARSRGLIRDGHDFDAIDAHYFYPDGVAAAWLASWFKRPLVVTARGSDVTQLPEHALPRRLILGAARRADAIVTVCRALKDELVTLGADGDKITVLRNGVDLNTFTPMLQRDARARLGLPATGRMVASIGHLIPRKGHELVIDAIATLPDTTLLIGGSGPERAALEARVREHGIADRVRFLGQLPHPELPCVYSAVDALVLASDREGWANVLLEAMACGTPVVATDVGGSAEVVTTPEAGVIVDSRSAQAIALALRHLLESPPDRAATRRFAERFSWDDTTRGQQRLFDAVTRSGCCKGLLKASVL